MTVTPKVYNFPTFPIEKQIFRVPGQAFDGAYTSGGARMFAPEPGGFGILEIQPSLQVNEWDFPLSSWLMSKANGAILRVRLTPTPQVCGGSLYRDAAGVPWDTDLVFSDGSRWTGGYVANYSSDALQGTSTVQVDMSDIGRKLQPGHVIGHVFDTYLVDEIAYDVANTATITITPPLRRDVTAGDVVEFLPYFTGMISNGSEISTTYDAGNNGAIQLPKIDLVEVVLP